MKPYTTLLFDLDGTLLDSKRSVLEAVYHTAEIYAPQQYTFQDIEDRFGEAFEDFVDIVAPHKKEEMIATYMEHITNHHDQLVDIFPKVQEALIVLKQRGIKLGIVTNKQYHLTIKGLELFQIREHFDTIVTLDDVKYPKPSPEPIIKAIEQLNVNASEVLMVGDTMFDTVAAKEASVPICILDWYGTYDKRRIQPDYMFSSIEEKMNYFGYSLKRESGSIG
ncbi:HAD-IA family hydrolase [Bacillus salitolerans]|uniref:HAD-IA family hydrolase n=1 Tax=Bacillus salitolerans TaxID=1437434 RepID=A0ABW4LUY9_9BACI